MMTHWDLGATKVLSAALQENVKSSVKCKDFFRSTFPVRLSAGHILFSILPTGFDDDHQSAVYWRIFSAGKIELKNTHIGPIKV